MSSFTQVIIISCHKVWFYVAISELSDGGEVGWGPHMKNVSLTLNNEGEELLSPLSLYLSLSLSTSFSILVGIVLSELLAPREVV